ncbi:MAG: HAMP domain-containing histidine kinase [Synergistaceae bacterium]|jgi:signal transduction histidine kinase|nr:HAMP domain-containing histidine kinase [Synergistaceae bacterium]
MSGQIRMKATRETLAWTLISVFVLAVLVPGIALSMLALRAAEREQAYVERRMEGALAAEVDLASRRVEQLMRDMQDSFHRELESGIGSSLPVELWPKADPLVGVPFTLNKGELSAAADSGEKRQRFMDIFAFFLTGGGRIPVYDLVTRIYRTEARTESAGTAYTAPLLAGGPAADSSLSAGNAGIARQMMESRIASDIEVRDEVFNQVSKEGFEILHRNVVPQAKKSFPEREGEMAEDAFSAPPPEDDIGSKSRVQIPGLADETSNFRMTRSKTVSRSRSFSELIHESGGGLLPYISDEGLEVLFWAKNSVTDVIIGCTVDMEILRDRIAEVIPDIFSEARILTVLDETGSPIVKPDAASVVGPDWSRPFVAREISPVLPRWEVGAWLSDPGALAATARYARIVIWVQVATLCSVMITGSIVLIRMMSYEMRVASQKTTFVANVSHELKTPLTSIRLYAEILLSGKQNDEERKREYLRTMMSEADRLSHLVDNVLSFSRRGSGNERHEPGKFSLTEVARATLSQLEPNLARSGFTVSFSADGALMVKGDRESLKQVIMNLLSNAEKYSGNAREIFVGCSCENGRALVSIADRGIGVEPEMKDKIFQEFVRGDDTLSAPCGGSGLGLSIARDIARRHGGDVMYAPRPGGGSVFTLLLPVCPGGGLRDMEG